MSKRTDWSEEQLVVRSKSGKRIAEWNRGTEGYVEKFWHQDDPAFGNTSKRTTFNNGTVHRHGQCARKGKSDSFEKILRDLAKVFK